MKQALLKAKLHSFISAKGEMRGSHFAFDDYDEGKLLLYICGDRFSLAKEAR